jgi:CubicO group peptidase (beta-lactamase class C family)
VKLLVFAALIAVVPTLSRADAIDDMVRQTMKASSVPGVSIAIVKDGHIVKAAGYGLAEVENQVPARPDTVWEIASLSKQFASTALMMLVEEGKVSIEDPVSKYLADTPPTWSTMKVENLLNHTSGLQDLILNPARLSSLAFFHYTRDQQLHDIEASSLRFAPGEKMAYSSAGYELVALIVEKASGEKFQDFLTERIFKPLGMTATDFVDLYKLVPHRSNGYTIRSGHWAVWKMSQTLGSLDLNGFGGIESSVLDLAKWEVALERSELLKPESWQTLWTPRMLNGGQVVDRPCVGAHGLHGCGDAAAAGSQAGSDCAVKPGRRQSEALRQRPRLRRESLRAENSGISRPALEVGVAPTRQSPALPQELLHQLMCGVERNAWNWRTAMS